MLRREERGRQDGEVRGGGEGWGGESIERYALWEKARHGGRRECFPPNRPPRWLRGTESTAREGDVENPVSLPPSLPPSPSSHRLAGLVVKASASRAEDPGFESRWRRDFPGSSHTSGLKIATTVATLPDVWRCRGFGVNGWSGVWCEGVVWGLV